MNGLRKTVIFRANMTLNIDFTFKSSDVQVIAPVILSIACFVLYWFVAQSRVVQQRFYSKYDHDTASANHIFFTKLFGFLSLGIVPALCMLLFLPDKGFSYYGLTFVPETSLFSFLWIIGLSAIVIPLAYYSAKKPKNLLNYPQIRSKLWTRSTYYKNIFGWVLYLSAYEFLFRGVLFFPLLESLGFWPATAVNISLYSATHIPKGLDETLGAIPLGLVLCALTAMSGTLWIAIIVHVAMALSNSLTALKFHPDIHYKRK